MLNLKKKKKENSVCQKPGKKCMTPAKNELIIPKNVLKLNKNTGDLESHSKQSPKKVWIIADLKVQLCLVVYDVGDKYRPRAEPQYSHNHLLKSS